MKCIVTGDTRTPSTRYFLLNTPSPTITTPLGHSSVGFSWVGDL